MGKFSRGVSGNPSGKVKGTLNKRTHLTKLLEPHAVDLINKVVELAINGDVNALRICIERLLPKIKGETLNHSFDTANLTDTSGLLQLGADVIEAVSNQDITPEQGKDLANLIQVQCKTIETTELANRVKEIEYALKIRKQKE